MIVIHPKKRCSVIASPEIEHRRMTLTPTWVLCKEVCNEQCSLAVQDVGTCVGTHRVRNSSVSDDFENFGIPNESPGGRKRTGLRAAARVACVGGSKVSSLLHSRRREVFSGRYGPPMSIQIRDPSHTVSLAADGAAAVPPK